MAAAVGRRLEPNERLKVAPIRSESAAHNSNGHAKDSASMSHTNRLSALDDVK